MFKFQVGDKVIDYEDRPGVILQRLAPVESPSEVDKLGGYDEPSYLVGRFLEDTLQKAGYTAGGREYKMFNIKGVLQAGGLRRLPESKVRPS